MYLSKTAPAQYKTTDNNLACSKISLRKAFYTKIKVFELQKIQSMQTKTDFRFGISVKNQSRISQNISCNKKMKKIVSQCFALETEIRSAYEIFYATCKHGLN